MTRGARARDLKNLVAALGVPGPSGGRVYEAVQIARGSHYRVGKDSSGNPVVLIATTDIDDSAALLDFEGRHLRINHCVSCSISVDGVEVEQRQFSVITCVEADDLLKERFFDAIETLLRSLGEMPTNEEFRQVINSLIELFRLATRPPRGTVQGLWAELWVIANAREPQVLLEAWHAEPTDAYDFNSGWQRIEVKSAGQRTRRHHFSHRQLTPPANARVVICSIFVESSGGGSTISDLVQKIRRRVSDPQAQRHLDYIVARTLGTEWRDSLGLAFDSELATESMCFYMVETVPRLSPATPAGISDIQYVSDLSLAEALSHEESLACEGLIAAAIPEAS